MTPSRAAAALIAIAVVFTLGCASRPAGDREPRAELPGYQTIYEGAERRIGTLEHLWASSVTSIRYTDAEGERHRDQGEGFFMMRRPGSLAILIGKLGETYLILGSDESRYWWMELLDDRVAYVGRTDDASAVSAEAVGVPVLPADLMLALDLVRWPEPGEPGIVDVEWSSLEGVDRARTVAVTLDDGGRTRRVHVDAVSLDPLAVELLSADGTVFAVSRLSRHDRVLNRVGAPVEPRIPMRAEVDLPAAEARLELTLSRAALDPRKPRPAVFDLDVLLERFGVDEVRDVRPPERSALAADGERPS